MVGWGFQPGDPFEGAGTKTPLYIEKKSKKICHASIPAANTANHPDSADWREFTSKALHTPIFKAVSNGDPESSEVL